MPQGWEKKWPLIQRRRQTLSKRGRKLPQRRLLHDEKLIEKETDVILEDCAYVVSRQISIGSFGAVAVQGEGQYSLFQCTSDPYLFTRASYTGEKVHTDEVLEGDIVVNAEVMECFKDRYDWYYPNGNITIIRLKQVVANNFEMKPISKSNKPPQGYPQGEPPFKNIKKVN